MSRKYKFHNPEGLYFVSFATVYWLDPQWNWFLFRDLYSSIIVERLDHCRKHKGMEVFCWCIMPSHLHLIFSAKENNPEALLGRFKEYTSKKLQKEIEDNPRESRKYGFCGCLSELLLSPAM